MKIEKKVWVVSKNHKYVSCSSQCELCDENNFGQHLCVFFFRGTCTGYVIHLFSMVSFFACTCPNQLGVAAIDNPDWFEHVFDR